MCVKLSRIVELFRTSNLNVNKTIVCDQLSFFIFFDDFPLGGLLFRDSPPVRVWGHRGKLNRAADGRPMKG